MEKKSLKETISEYVQGMALTVEVDENAEEGICVCCEKGNVRLDLTVTAKEITAIKDFIGVLNGLGAEAGREAIRNAALEHASCFEWQLKVDGKVLDCNLRNLPDGPLPDDVKETLQTCVIQEAKTEIGQEAFSGCSSLTSVTIPDGVTKIGECAFCGCSSLTSVAIPDSVTAIGAYAFSGCSSLTSVTIPDSVTKIGGRAFQGCGIQNLEHECHTIKNGLAIKEGKLIYCADANMTVCVIPDSVTAIENSAFRGCSSLTSVAIPEGVTEIGAYAFCVCSSLTSVAIPGSVTAIGNSAFDGCSSLTSVAISEGVTRIEWCAFTRCSSLTSVEIPEGVTGIEWGAFKDCSSLTSVAIPDSVTEIEENAFEGCSSLMSVRYGGTESGFAKFKSSFPKGCKFSFEE